MAQIKADDPLRLAAARAHLNSTGWRFGQAATFAVGIAFVLNSAPAGIGWMLVATLSLGFDHMLGKSYIDARSARDRRTSGILFAWGCMFSLLMYVAMVVIVAFTGGASGRVLSLLMAASLLVGVMLFQFRDRGFMVLLATPLTIVLLAAPLIPISAGPANALMGAVGVACGTVAFVAYLTRAALSNAKLVVNLEDATARAREGQIEAEAKRADAEAANNAKSEFLTTMTHELRTPLNAVIGYAEMIGEDLAADGRADDDARRIAASGRHLLALIDQILQLSMMESGRTQLAIADINVRHLVEDAVASATLAAKANNNRISIRTSSDVSTVRTDRDKLALCLGHLLSNAAKFTANGLIAVSAERESEGGRDWLKLAVSDTGAGMRAEDMDRAFLPFVQLDGSATRAQGGMGLGLTITQRTARTLGGAVSVSSELAKGSTFTLRIPLRLGDSGTGEQKLPRMGEAA